MLTRLCVMPAEDDKTPTKAGQRPASMLISKRPGSTKSKEETATPAAAVVVKVPDQDDAEDFFTPTATVEYVEVTSEDFDDIFFDSANL